MPKSWSLLMLLSQRAGRRARLGSHGLVRRCTLLLSVLLLGSYSVASQAFSVHVVAESIAMHHLQRPVWVQLRFPPKQMGVYARQPIERLLLQLQTRQPAELAVALCNAQRKQCQEVPPSGRLFGPYFTEQRLEQPLWLRVEALSWQQAYPPAFARAELIAWPQLPTP